MEPRQLIEEFEKEFELMRKEYKLKATLKELESVLFLRDAVLKQYYVPRPVSRMICSVIVDNLKMWANYLYSLIMPNPQSMPNISESQIFNEADKNKFAELISEVMELSSKNSINVIKKDKKAEVKFIDDSLVFWNKKFQPELVKVLDKVHKRWKTNRTFEQEQPKRF